MINEVKRDNLGYLSFNSFRNPSWFLPNLKTNITCSLALCIPLHKPLGRYDTECLEGGKCIWGNFVAKRHNGSLFHFNTTKLVENTLWNNYTEKSAINILEPCSYVYKSIISNRSAHSGLLFFFKKLSHFQGCSSLLKMVQVLHYLTVEKLLHDCAIKPAIKFFVWHI